MTRRKGPTKAGFDYGRLGALLQRKLYADGRGWRACAHEIGCSPAALSRLGAGQAVAAHSVIACCNWLGVSLWDYYTWEGECFTGRTVKQGPTDAQ